MAANATDNHIHSPDRPGAIRILQVPFHPIPVFLFPVLSLLAWNIQELYPDQAVRSLGVSVAAAALLWMILAAALRNPLRAAILATLVGIFLFSYGPLYEVIEDGAIAGFTYGRHRYLLPVWLGLLLLVSAGVLRSRGSLEPMSLLLNLVALAAVLMPLATLVTFYVHSRGSTDLSKGSLPVVRLKVPAGETPPDIYYIILDGYARSDFMRRSYGYDNSEFLAFLEQQGFFVAAESRSNHNYTSLSLSSSLNLTFAQDLGVEMRKGYYPTPFVEPIRHSLVRRALEEAGYRMVAMQSSYIPTEIADASVFLAATDMDTASVDTASWELPSRPNAFEMLLLKRTPLKPLIEKGILFPYKTTPFRFANPEDLLRDIILFQFESLPGVPQIDGPKFVFVHVVAPHSPYLFGPNGEHRSPRDPYTLVEAEGEAGQHATAYADQARYISTLTETAIQGILKNSATEPVIIVQADHGSGVDNSYDQRTAILNAILIREECREALYPAITPVNTFRIVFNCYFDAGLPLLEDKVFFSPSPRYADYKFRRVDTELDVP